MVNVAVFVAKDVEVCDRTVADVKSLAPAVDSAGKLWQLAQRSLVLIPIENVKLGIWKPRCRPSASETIARQNTRATPAREKKDAAVLDACNRIGRSG